MTRNRTLPTLIRELASKRPDAIYLEEIGGRTLTYEQTHEAALRWADAYRRIGVARGDCVATMLPNSIDALLSWLGLCWLGAWEVPISTQYRGRLLEHTLTNSNASLLVTNGDVLASALSTASDLGSLSTVLMVDADLSQAERFKPLRFVALEEFLNDARPDDGLEAPTERDVASVLYTSGTTGPSKGVIVRWGQVFASAIATFPMEDLNHDDILYSFGATNHIGAKSLPFTMALAGGKLVLRDGFSTSSFWDDIDTYRCTTVGLLGAMAHFVFNQRPDENDRLHPLKNVLMAPVHPQVREFEQRFGVRVCTAYNMTEISVPIRHPSWNVDDPKSCGYLRTGYPYYEVRIVDENDYELGSGQVGELIVRTGSPWTLNGGYLNMPEAAVEAWRNGWFHTGDAFYRDESGRYYFVDRIKDTIRRRGENISSAEVEAEVNAHAAVYESAAVAVPSDTSEDEVMVFVQLKEGHQLNAEELLEFLSSRMARYMVPRYVEFVSDFPRTHTERIRKVELRKRGVTSSTWDRESISLPVSGSRTA